MIVIQFLRNMPYIFLSVTYDTAVAIWQSGHLRCDLGQTKFVTNMCDILKRIKGKKNQKFSLVTTPAQNDQ